MLAFRREAAGARGRSGDIGAATKRRLKSRAFKVSRTWNAWGAKAIEVTKMKRWAIQSGTPRQVEQVVEYLSKRTNDDYDTEWIAAPSTGQTYARMQPRYEWRRDELRSPKRLMAPTQRKYVTPEGVKAAVTAAVASTPTAGPVLFVNTLSDLPPGTFR